MSVAAQVADVSDEESCFLRDADISEIECDAVRAAAKASPAARLLDLKNNCLIRRFAGLSQLFPILESLVLSNNVLGDCSPSMPSSWAAALASPRLGRPISHNGPSPATAILTMTGFA